MREHRTPAPIPEPCCDGCGKQGISYRLTLTSVLRPTAQRHRHYCVSCWLVLRATLFETAKGAVDGQ